MAICAPKQDKGSYKKSECKELQAVALCNLRQLKPKTVKPFILTSDLIRGVYTAGFNLDCQVDRQPAAQTGGWPACENLHFFSLSLSLCLSPSLAPSLSLSVVQPEGGRNIWHHVAFSLLLVVTVACVCLQVVVLVAVCGFSASEHLVEWLPTSARDPSMIRNVTRSHFNQQCDLQWVSLPVQIRSTVIPIDARREMRRMIAQSRYRPVL